MKQSQHSAPNNASDYFEAQIINIADYSPFNVELDGRTIKNDFYRYSVQGQERHDEINGEGNYINYKYRGYDPRIGRLDWMIDPLAYSYPELSPYQFSSNRLLDAIELEGLEAWEIKREWEAKDEAAFGVFVSEKIIEFQERGIYLDCADLAVVLLVEYAEREGLDVSFTSYLGKELRASDKLYKNFGSDRFLNDKYLGILGKTNAKSLLNDMKDLDEGELPKPGNITNSGTHVNIVRNEKKSDNISESDRYFGKTIPISSGSLPPRIPKDNVITINNNFKEWKVIDEATKNDIKIDKLSVKPAVEILNNAN